MKSSVPFLRRSGAREERGSALLLALVIGSLLSLIGLSLTFSSMAEFTTSNEFEAHEKALILADAGYKVVKDELRGQDFTTLLATSSLVPKYLEYQDPQSGSYAARNPLVPYEARNIDFENPPAALASRSVNGFLTPLGGTLLGTGRYFASLSDNLDETPLGLAEDPRLDSDYTVNLRVMGVHRTLASEVSSVGTSVKNALAIVEATLRRDLSFDLSSPLAVYGSDVQATFNGNSFDLIGDAEHSAISVINDDPAGGDADQAYDSMLAALGSKGTVEGATGPDGVSLVDSTESLRSSENPDATNVFDPDFLNNLVNLLASVADVLYTQDTMLGAGSPPLGTVADPQITVAMGNLDLTGNNTGAGILVVNGIFDLGGSFIFDGLVLVIGEGDIRLHGANKDLVGGVYVAKIVEDVDGTLTFGVPTLDISGNSNFIFDSGDIQMAINLLPLKTLSYREITPEIEPTG
ncbi:MAG: hypothetical protein ACE5JX_20160 [Acidobacteriota bacterium]